MLRKKLFLHQSLFLQAPFLYETIRFFMLVAGYGAGKSIGIADLLHLLVDKLNGKRDLEGHRPTIVLGGISKTHLENTTIKYIMQDYENAKVIYNYDKKRYVIHVLDVDIIIVSLSDYEKIAGFDAVVGILDELDDLGSLTNAEEVTYKAFKAMNERIRQVVPGFREPFMMMATTSQGQKGMYRLYTHFKKRHVGYVKIRGRTEDNTTYGKSYIQGLLDIYTPEEKAVFMDGEFLAISSGQVFPAFDWDKHYLADSNLDKHIRDNEVLYWGQDFNQGYHRGSIAVIREGRIFFIKRYEFSDMTDAPKVIRADFPVQKIYCVPDTTGKDIIRNFVRELKRYNINMIFRAKNPIVEDSAMLVNKLMHTGRLFFTKMANDTAEAVARARRDSNGEIPKGKGKESPIHDCDSVRLVSYYITTTKKEFRSMRKLILLRHIKAQQDMEDDSSIEEEEEGYLKLSADVLN